MQRLVTSLTSLGLSEKAAKVYLAALTLGEGTVLDLARVSSVRRTSIYYVLDELRELGAIIETKRNKKMYYLPDEPKDLLRRLRERALEAEGLVMEFEKLKHAAFRKPRVYFLYGPAGFKQIWDMVLSGNDKQYRIITTGEGFLDFVKEKYILDEIIKTKKDRAISSRQLIVDSPYARKIVSKDSRENRISKFLPKSCLIPFTEVITSEFAAFISPRIDNTLLVIENQQFAATRIALFEAQWESLR